MCGPSFHTPPNIQHISRRDQHPDVVCRRRKPGSSRICSIASSRAALLCPLPCQRLLREQLHASLKCECFHFRIAYFDCLTKISHRSNRGASTENGSLRGRLHRFSHFFDEHHDGDFSAKIQPIGSELPDGTFHLQLDQPIQFHRILHRQFLYERFDKPGDDHGRSFCL